MSSPSAALWRITCGRWIALATPCGTPKYAPAGCDIACTDPSAIVIARLAAISMLPRASSSSSPRSTARSRLSRIIRSACSDRASWCGLLSVDTYPSTACVIASIPVAAATGAGSVRVVSGSRIARRGKSGKSAISSLTFSSGSFTTAAIDTSLPVPAVVGMHASGAISSGRPRPSSSRGIRRKPSCSRAVPPWVKRASATLAVSITEPPPTARNESAPASLAAPAQRSTTSVEESCGTSSNTPATSSRPSATPASTFSTTGFLELPAVAREDRLHERHKPQDLRHRPLRLHLPAREGDGDVHLAEPEAVRRVGVHRHDHLGLQDGVAEVDLAVLAFDQLHRDARLGLAVLVLDDRVRLAELGGQLLVVLQVLEQLPDGRVDLVGVLEVGHRARKSIYDPGEGRRFPRPRPRPGPAAGRAGPSGRAPRQ